MTDDAPVDGDDSFEARYRAMTRAAPALFTAEGREELEAEIRTLASTIVSTPEFYLRSFAPAGSESYSAAQDGPTPAVCRVAAEAMGNSPDLDSNRAVLWITPSRDSAAPDSTRLPVEIALVPLAPRAGSNRAILLVYANDAPSEDERALIHAFARLVREAVEACSPDEDRTLQEDERTSGLIEVVNSIASQLELPEVIQIVAEKTSQLLNADRSSVWIYDEDAEEIYTLVAQKLDTEEIRMPADEGLAGHVPETGQSLILEDAYEHPAFDPTRDRETGYRTQSMLCMPLYDGQGEKLGVFQVINKLEGDCFTEDDEALLEALANSASVAIENALLYEEQKEQFESFIQVLATTIDSRDPTTGTHTVLVTGIAVLIAEEMGLAPSTVEKVRVAGVLHDIGKIVLPDDVLLKQGKLDDEERKIAQSHANHTIRILERIHFHRDLAGVPEIAASHHERMDGEGYPRGLTAEELTLPMRILAVADVFHALIQERPYKEGFSIEAAIEECRRISSSDSSLPDEVEHAHLDPRVVDALVQNIEREGRDNFRERAVEHSGFEEENVFAPNLNLPD